jgi:L-ascorbate metabolism protein UlaG (beta-lactamase superfamily)
VISGSPSDNGTVIGEVGMKLTKFGHATYLIEESNVRLLLDPGAFSQGFENESDLAAILYTHNHGDHYDETKLAKLIKNNPHAMIIADHDTAHEIKSAGYDVVAVNGGDEVTVAGIKIKAIGHDHAVIHRLRPQAKNVGYMVADRLFYPGDALTEPNEPVEILLLPVAAPWTKVEEVVDYLELIQPMIALPSHEAILAMPAMVYGMIADAAGELEIDFRPLENGDSIEI